MSDSPGIKLSLDDSGIHQIASLVASQVVEQFKTLGWAPQNGIPEHLREQSIPGHLATPPMAQKVAPQTPNGTRNR